MRRLPRWSLFVVFLLVLVLGAASSLLITTVRRPLPTVSGQLRIAGLSAPVLVLRDANGIPNLYADDAEDLFEAQGYVAAQDRFYEMDIRRHITAGRLSELFGASQVQTDAYIRTMGWRRTAAAELPMLSSATRRYLDAYSAGVNAYLNNNSVTELSLEYSVLKLTGLDYTPEPWTAVDSLAWLKAMSWDLDGNLDQEVSDALVTASMGARRAADLYPAYRLGEYRPIVAGGSIVDGKFRPGSSGQNRPAPAGLGTGSGGSTESARNSAGDSATTRPADGQDGPSRAELQQAVPALEAAAKVHSAIPSLLGTGGADAGIGSNSWVVSGAHTTTGKPLLENDPHLDISIPGIFTQVGLHCRRLTASCPFDVSGFAFSGMPGVIIGHNQSISWGFTDSYPDVQDLYLEQVRGNTARVGNRYQPLTVRTEQIAVRDEAKPRTITVRTSRHGPLLSDVDPQLKSVGQSSATDAQNGHAVALQWEALIPGRSMDALFGIDAATDFSRFRRAAALLSGPSQNMVYADTNGTIGYQLPGHFPLRGKGNGDLPAPGWDADYDWRGTIPFAELPYLQNPSDGVIVTANQTVIGSSYPHKLGADYSYGWRSQELVDQLTGDQPLSPGRADSLFYDDTMRYAASIVPALLKVRIDDAWVRQGQRTLVGWNYHADADSAAAAYFSIVFHDLLQLGFDDQLPASEQATGGDRWYAVVAKLLTEPDNPWWDDVHTGTVETRDDILVEAMTQARKEATVLMSRDVSGWRWGRLHQVRLKNQTLGMSGNAAVERLFNRGGFEVSGAPAVVNALGYNELEGYRPTVGPSMRMLVDLSDLDASRWVNQTGESGHAYDTNYDDQLQLWATDRLLPFRFSRASVDAAATHQLTLVPAG